MASVVHYTGHGFIAGSAIYFSNLVGGDGIVQGTLYYVIAAGLTANDFEFSTTVGGAAFTFNTDITSGNVSAWPTYDVLNDGVTVPPTVPPTPTAPTVTSAVVSGIVRLQISLNDTAEAKVRAWEVQSTHKFDSSGNPDWTSPAKITLPEGSTAASLPAIGSTVYNVRVAATDVYGNVSAFSAPTGHTTIEGADAIAALLATLSNDVSHISDFATKIDPGSITTPLLRARSVTADILAATIVLTSLLKTANSGRRVEIDIDGIRLYDTDESLLVRIPTNSDPVYVKGQVNADSLISQTAASFRTAVSIESSAVATLQNGVSTPANPPSLAASVDYLTLASIKPSLISGIGYDSGAGTFWVAADPTTTDGIVAYEFNATTGAFVRSIPKTGVLTTYTATVGATSHVSDTAQATSGGTQSQVATPITIPGGLSNVHITKVSVYCAGYGGSANCKNAIWNTSNTLLAESAAYTAASKTLAVGASIHYDKALTAPYPLAAGATVRAGFLHTSTADGFQWDRDDGSGKTTYIGDGEDGNLTSVATDTARKPNIYLTYTYDVDTTVETAMMIGVCTDGTYIYTLDANGVIYKYNRSTLAFVTKADVSANITGTKANAGLFAHPGGLIVTTSTGTGAGVYPKFIEFDFSLALVFSYTTAASGPTFSGTTDTFRGGVELNDPLNGSILTWWVATTNGVYAYNWTGNWTYTANRDFGTAATVRDGITYDGTQFRGWNTNTPDKVWKFSNWDWTTASAVYWIGYAWYDSVVTTHETAAGPRSSITMRRRERVQVSNAAITLGTTDDPNNVRIYMLPGAANWAAGAAWLQVTDALTSRYLTTYTGSGTHDGTGLAFPAGTPAEIKSGVLGWSLKGDGSMVLPGDRWLSSQDGFVRLYFAGSSRSYYASQDGHEFRKADSSTVIARFEQNGALTFGGAVFPTSPLTGQHYFRTDLGMDFYYDGTRWLSKTLFTAMTRGGPIPSPLAATEASVIDAAAPTSPGSDIYLVDLITQFLVSSGGTALGASHKWVQSFFKRPTGNTETTLVSPTIASGASSAWRTDTSSINALMNNGTIHYAFSHTWTKTGTPGSLYWMQYITYRIVAT